jgi:hypothetical protein
MGFTLNDNNNNDQCEGMVSQPPKCSAEFMFNAATDDDY